MRSINTWWSKMAETLAGGINQGAIRKTLTDTLMPPDLGAKLLAGVNVAGLSTAPSPRLDTIDPYASDATRAKSMAAATTIHQTNTFNQTPANADPVAISSSIAWRMKTLRS